MRRGVEQFDPPTVPVAETLPTRGTRGSKTVQERVDGKG